MLIVLFLFLLDCELIEMYICHYNCKSVDSRRGCGLPLTTVSAGDDTASSVGSTCECGVRNVAEAPSPVGE